MSNRADVCANAYNQPGYDKLISEANMNRDNMNRQMTLKKAARNLRRWPLNIVSEKDACNIDGVGPKLAELIVRAIKRHQDENQVPEASEIQSNNSNGAVQNRSTDDYKKGSPPWYLLLAFHRLGGTASYTRLLTEINDVRREMSQSAMLPRIFEDAIGKVLGSFLIAPSANNRTITLTLMEFTVTEDGRRRAAELHAKYLLSQARRAAAGEKEPPQQKRPLEPAMIQLPPLKRQVTPDFSSSNFVDLVDSEDEDGSRSTSLTQQMTSMMQSQSYSAPAVVAAPVQKAAPVRIEKHGGPWFMLTALRCLDGKGSSAALLDQTNNIRRGEGKKGITLTTYDATVDKLVSYGLVTVHPETQDVHLTPAGVEKAQKCFDAYVTGDVDAADDPPRKNSSAPTSVPTSQCSSSSSSRPLPPSPVPAPAAVFVFEIPDSPPAKAPRPALPVQAASRPVSQSSCEVVDLCGDDDDEGCAVSAFLQSSVQSSVASSTSSSILARLTKLTSTAASRPLNSQYASVSSSIESLPPRPAPARSVSSSVESLPPRAAIKDPIRSVSSSMDSLPPRPAPTKEPARAEPIVTIQVPPLNPTKDTEPAFNNLVPLSLPLDCYEVVLLIDQRERKEKDLMVSKLHASNPSILVEFSTLAVGDFLFICRPQGASNLLQALVLDTVIERKITSDLASSIIDGRFKEQKFRMHRSGLAKKLYLVENGLAAMYTGAVVSSEVIKTAIVTTAVNDDIQVIRSRNIDNSIEFLEALYMQMQRRFLAGLCCFESATNKYLTFDEFQSKNTKRNVETLGELFEVQMKQVKNCGALGAIGLSSHYGTLGAFMADATEKTSEEFIYSVAQLRRGDGRGERLGSKLGEQLWKLFGEKF